MSTAERRRRSPGPRVPQRLRAGPRQTLKGRRLGGRGSGSGADGLGLPSGATAARGAQSHGHRAPGASLPETLGALSTGAVQNPRQERTRSPVRPSLSSGASPHNLPRQKQALPLRLYSLRGALAGRTARTERGRAPAPGPRGQTRVGLGRAEGLSGRRVPRTFPLAVQRLYYRGRCLLLVLGGGSPRTPALRVTARPHLEQTPRPGCCTC